MTTEQKKQAIQAGKALLENDGTVEQLNKAFNYTFDRDVVLFGFYKFYNGLHGSIGLHHNPNNLPTIHASTFFIDEPDEPMINISLKRLEEIAQVLTNEIEASKASETFRNGCLHGIYTLRDLLKSEAK